MYLLEAPKDDPLNEREKFAVFGEACRLLEEAEIPYVMGGGVAIRAYGRTRPLKDADIFLQRERVFPAMDHLTREGGFHTRDTDATWLFKALKRDVLVDIIVRTTGNIHMSEQTLLHARRFELYGYSFNMMGPEDLLFRKIHSHREGRPDQFDAISMLAQPLPLDFDWDYFMEMVFTNDVRRVLGFFYWAQAEAGENAVPPSVMRALTERVLEVA